MLGGLLFDLDGTLVDTNDQHARAWGEAFRACGYRVGHERLLRAMGIGGDNLVAEVLGDDAEARDGEALRAADREIYAALIGKEGVRQTPGASALLRAVADRGLPMALATSSPEKSTRHVLALAGLHPAAFRVIVGGDGVASSKPSPDVLVEACRRLDLAPSAVGLIGDTVADTRAARDAGIAVLGVASGGHGAELQREGARRVYTDPYHVLSDIDAALTLLSPGPLVLTAPMLDALLDAAFSLAEEGLAKGGVPIGCVIAEADGSLVAAAHNESSLGPDPVGHAEIVAFRRAETPPQGTHARLLASTLEPCVMCAGACMEIGIDTVVYGLRASEDGGVQRVRPPRSPENQTPRFVGPRHAGRARALFAEFLTKHGDHPSAPFVASLLSADAVQRLRRRTRASFFASCTGSRGLAKASAAPAATSALIRGTSRPFTATSAGTDALSWATRKARAAA